MVPTQVQVTDITGQEKEFTLESCGFQLVTHETKSKCSEDGFQDEDLIKIDYFSECEQLLKDVYVSCFLSFSV